MLLQYIAGFGHRINPGGYWTVTGPTQTSRG